MEYCPGQVKLQSDANPKRQNRTAWLSFLNKNLSVINSGNGVKFESIILLNYDAVMTSSLLFSFQILFLLYRGAPLLSNRLYGKTIRPSYPGRFQAREFYPFVRNTS